MTLSPTFWQTRQCREQGSARLFSRQPLITGMITPTLRQLKIGVTWRVIWGQPKWEAMRLFLLHPGLTPRFDQEFADQTVGAARKSVRRCYRKSLGDNDACAGRHCRFVPGRPLISRLDRSRRYCLDFGVELNDAGLHRFFSVIGRSCERRIARASVTFAKIKPPPGRHSFMARRFNRAEECPAFINELKI
jgi:hypothetical protein